MEFPGKPFTTPLPRRDAFSAFWILLCSWLVISGWGLSLVGTLNPLGYAVSLGLFGFLIFSFTRFGLLAPRRPRFRSLMRRYRRPLPLIYLACLLAAFLGGTLYPPTNYDAITYRIPRVLHWLAEGNWHWIAAWNVRLNYSGTGMEWIMAPFLAIFSNDRLFFLINVVSYALLPGVLYSTFTVLGISRRVAWYWMWLLPTGYCFVTQAGSIGNDSFAAVYFLAALSFGARSLFSRSAFDLSLAMLSAGLLTGAKASNLPLLLPIAFVMAPAAWRILSQRLGTSSASFKFAHPGRHVRPDLFPRDSGVGVQLSNGSSPRFLFRLSLLSVAALAALAVSFVPIAVINTIHTGDWSGDPENEGRMKLSNPVYGVVGNTLQLAVGCAAPPVFPVAGTWNKIAQSVVESPALSRVRNEFPRLSLSLNELPSEEGSGLGLGISLVVAISLVFAVFSLRSGVRSRLALAVGICCFVAFGAYVAKMGSECTARILATYYPGLLIPLLALNSQSTLVVRRWWRALAIVAAMSAFPVLILNPARPLFPVQPTLALAKSLQMPPSLIDRASAVYSVYSARNDNLAVVREHLPPGANTIGFSGTGDESDLSFWRPFGQRKVVDLTPFKGGIPEMNGVDCVVGSTWGFNDRFGLSAHQFAEKVGGHVFWQVKVATRAGSAPLEWSIIVLEKPNDNWQPDH